MRPRTAGTKAASLVISYEGGATAVPLAGDGFLPKVEAERIGTYYSCQAQAGAGVWLLGLGVAALLWRRRRRRG
jgi:MYXO-CTERM domain-containing protein